MTEPRRWLYPANVRIPSEKAHVYQILQMVDALRRAGVEVEVAYPARANLPGLERQDPVALYGLRARPCLVELPTVDLVRLVTIDVPALNRRPLPQFAFALQSITFALNAARFTRRTVQQRSRSSHALYGRDWPVLAACLRFAPDLPAFWEAHDLPQGATARAALRRLLPRLAGVVAISRGLRDALVDLGVPAGKILVAPDAVDLSRFSRLPDRQAARKALGLPSEAKIVVYAGHLYPWKGAHTLALASRHVPADTLACIVGGTPADLAAFHTFVAEQRLERVRLTGHVPPGEVPTWLAAADALALPNSAQETISTRYTSPLKLFEYMAARRPIVASDLPSLREVLGHDHNALLVPPDDPVAFAAGLTTLLADPARGERLAGAAWRDVQTRTWDARVGAIVTFVQQSVGTVTSEGSADSANAGPRASTAHRNQVDSTNYSGTQACSAGACPPHSGRSGAPGPALQPQHSLLARTQRSRGPSDGAEGLALALARLLFALPDLHRLPPYWRTLRRLRTAVLRRLHPAVAPTATIHQGFYAHRGISLTLGEGAEIRDRVRLGIDESGVRTSHFVLGEGSVVLSDTHVDCSAPVVIGQRTHVGRRNQLFTHSHDTARRDVPVLDAPIETAPITIGDDVMLYNEVVVLPGVTIGDGAVIAIRAVVTRDVPPYAKVAGIPARVIGERR